MPLDTTSLDLDTLIDREWLSVNGIGGFACSTVVGLNTRKYHGLLVAAMSPPVRRMVLLSRVEETVTFDGWTCPLACNEYPGTISPRGDQSLVAFDAGPFPRWAYQGQGWTLEKSLRLVPGENTVLLSYTLLGGDRTVDLELRPMFALRPIHELMYQWNGKLTVEERSQGHYRIPPTSKTPEAFFAHDGEFKLQHIWYLNTIYRREQERGYGGLEDLWTPGIIRWTLHPGQTVHFACSADPIDLASTISRADAPALPLAAHAQPLAVPSLPSPPNHNQPDQQALDLLLQAASQFIVDLPQGHSASPSIQADFAMAFFPWAPPSPRHTLIGFTGLFLIPGRFEAARRMLLAMADRLVDGLLPSTLLETGDAAVYRGADVSLWFINAILAYLRYTGDESVIRDRLLDIALNIIDHYRNGTRLGIGTDEFGLLHAGHLGIATTWMDAQINDWVLTPRNGMAVEVNALWYNAVRTVAYLLQRINPDAAAETATELESFAASIKAAFNRRFWNAPLRSCFDVVDGDAADPAVRPNQLLAISLPFPVLQNDRWDAVLERVRDELLVPTGVRTLSPADPIYQPYYNGNVISRDRAYHNGSAFPWLLGPYITAYLRVHGRGVGARSEARQILEPVIAHMSGPGSLQLCELFDGDRPHRCGGAIAAASAVAEVLRALHEEVLDRLPPLRPASQPTIATPTPRP